MSSAPSKKPQSAEPAFDLDYSIHDFEVEHFPDSTYLFQQIEDAMVKEGALPEGRTLDVACGVGRLAARFQNAGGQGWGIEPSGEMLGLSRLIVPRDAVVLTRGVAEKLPFGDGVFDRIVCQGALDHFVEPRAFMAEAARVVRPDGRVIVALANYESLSCRLGRPLQQAYWRLRNRQPEGRPYWQIPDDHFHEGSLDFVRQLGGQELTLERAYGLSLFWLFPGWGQALAFIPSAAGTALLAALNKLAHGRPTLSDTIVSVWKKPS